MCLGAFNQILQKINYRRYTENFIAGKLIIFVKEFRLTIENLLVDQKNSFLLMLDAIFCFISFFQTKAKNLWFWLVNKRKETTYNMAKD